MDKKKCRHQWQPAFGKADDTGCIMKCTKCAVMIFTNPENYNYVIEMQQQGKQPVLYYADTEEKV